MTTNQILLAIAAGIIAAVVFASATTGPMLLRLVLFFLAPLSLYLAGLGIGPAAAFVGAAVATLAIFFMTSPIAAAVFAVSTGAPAALLTRLALLGRREGSTEDAPMEWYPIGRIVLAAAMFAALFVALALGVMGGDTETLAKTIRTLVQNFAANEMPQIPGSAPLTDVQIDEIAARALNLLPTTLAALSMIVALLNLWLGGRITLASGQLMRPWPDLSQIRLPASATFALLAALAASFLEGIGGLLASGVAGALTIAFAFMGLAFVHAITRGSPWRSFILAALYTVLLLYTPAIGLLLAVVGLAESIFSYRASREQPPPSGQS